MKTKLFTKPNILIYFYLILVPLVAYSQSDINSFLSQEFNLAGERSQEMQFFVMNSECINYALDGKRVSKDVYKLYLKWTPAKMVGKDGDEYTCIKFIVQFGDVEEVTIPALANWSYLYREGIDEKSQVFGIDHSKFENLKDNNNNLIPTNKAYHVYNAFIDFHGFCNVFAEQTAEGNGIQDLKKISQKVVHAAAFSEPPVHLGKNILEGSFFKNGEITLEFKGLSVVNERDCALIGFDSGESSFKMIVKPMPDFEVVAVGSSHYKGDLYKDLASNWIQKVTFNEIVVTEATMPMSPNKVHSVVERNVIIRNVTEGEFLRY